jgi:[ribosomal protein S18]-alanine N-acetyltransferase
MATPTENARLRGQTGRQIRRMTDADLPRVTEIATSLPQSPHWPELTYLNAVNPESTPRRIALVAVVSGNVHGFAVASLLPPQAELESIAVVAGSQRLGLGRMLFEALVEELRAEGELEIVLEVRESNRAAIAFYRSAGFSQTGLRSTYYTDPIEDAVLMRLQLP